MKFLFQAAKLRNMPYFVYTGFRNILKGLPVDSSYEAEGLLHVSSDSLLLKERTNTCQRCILLAFNYSIFTLCPVVQAKVLVVYDLRSA
jgi:hypothetical protein